MIGMMWLATEHTVSPGSFMAAGWCGGCADSQSRSLAAAHIEGISVSRAGVHGPARSASRGRYRWRA